MNVWDFFTTFLTVEGTVTWMRQNGLLRKTPPPCPTCGGAMTEVKTGRGGDGVIWRCPKHKTQKQSIRDGSFFSHGNLPLRTYALLLYCWSCELQVGVAKDFCGVSERHTIQWYQYFRDACSWFLTENPRPIGGPGHVVQLLQDDKPAAFTVIVRTIAQWFPCP